ncbi:hypothetical protein Q9295_08620 [Xinfangfangia sp. CPCC 101601]|uniref:Uncharacterized protein n=1 Tax=Pseudogemmobacter lacusdianii TaxID=3069608 RepID=A0ABU0VXJ2_9RHOB|nr:hypothetical protein [Xinfangfangia sp. CPCC 101601]MDQ2066434.1 hypothetical protein [Xinfangfangia sp. CPCC 101601]
MLSRRRMIGLSLAFGSAVAMPAAAKSPELQVELHLSSGPLPPQYAWSNAVTITTEGLVTLKTCEGYETEGAACESAKGQATPESLTALRDAILAANLLKSPARESETPVIGGPATTARILLDGTAITLPAQPAAADAPRVQAVLNAIKAAIPADLAAKLTRD